MKQGLFLGWMFAKYLMEYFHNYDNKKQFLTKAIIFSLRSKNVVHTVAALKADYVNGILLYMQPFAALERALISLYFC